uniref:Oxidative stress protein n=1 Tax=Aurelia aurita TaxID=6145 RepID=Q5EN85_AURAU|nr:oxidative stress protein [Aurelia aurita]
MALSVKAYLNFEEGNPEIRRFSIEQDVSASYEYLMEKIRRVYPSLLRKNFQLFWRDEEEELVAFSSDEELVIALGSSSGDNFRVYIKVQAPSDSTDGATPNQKAKHPGVVCDVCDKGIEGTRFKCLACPDYDLCSGCESKGFHPEHEMLRMRTPNRHPWHGIWSMVFGQGGRGGPFGRRGHHGRGRHGPRPHCPRFAHHGGPNMHGPPGRGGCRGGFGDPRGAGWYGPWGCHFQSNENNEEKTDKTTQQQGAEGNPPNPPPYPSFEEVFDQVSQAVGQFFNPDQANTWGYSEATQENSNQERQEEKAAKQEEAGTDNGTAEDAPMPQSEASFIVINKEMEESKESADQNPSQSAEPSAPSQSQSRRREEEEFERKLNEAIRQMENMGFNNDSGWLTQLLISKDFDIGKVIDTLQVNGNK